MVILMPTCQRYASLAQLTCRWIGHFWSSHPSIVVCGVPAFNSARVLPTSAAPTDWIGIVHEAASQLVDSGVTDGYLILDDHPPVAACNALFLNESLPALARRFGAVCVGLSGWDQFHACPGEELGGDALWLRRLPPEFKWKFSLHPAYWDFRALRELLARLMREMPRPTSARDFEARTGATGGPVPREWNAAAYRVAGDRFSVGRGWLQARGKRWLATRLLHTKRTLVRTLLGPDAEAAFDRSIEHITRYLNGPYPMVWSGLMQRGQPHAAAREFLLRTNQHQFVADLDGVFRQMGPP